MVAVTTARESDLVGSDTGMASGLVIANGIRRVKAHQADGRPTGHKCASVFVHARIDERCDVLKIHIFEVSSPLECGPTW